MMRMMRMPYHNMPLQLVKEPQDVHLNYMQIH